MDIITLKNILSIVAVFILVWILTGGFHSPLKWLSQFFRRMGFATAAVGPRKKRTALRPATTTPWLKLEPEDPPRAPAARATPATHAADEFKLFVLNVTAPLPQSFLGDDLLIAFNELGFIYGKMRLFHCYTDQDESKPLLFSVASLLEPGSFDLEAIDSFSTRGLTLFFKGAATIDPVQAYETMLKYAELLATRLKGEIRTERQVLLTPEHIEQQRSILVAL